MQSLRVLSSRLAWRIVSLKDILPSLPAAFTKPLSKRQEDTTLAVSTDFSHPSDRFIPTTRRELTGRLIQEKGVIMADEEAKFERFAIALDAALTSRHHKALADMKQYYDPLDPDKDTLFTQKVLERDRLDREFWLLRGLDMMACRASYYELPQRYLNGLLREHDAREGVRVSVNPHNYSTLRVWVRGQQDQPIEAIPPYQQVFGRVRSAVMKRMGHKEDKRSAQIYKRVILAVRHKSAKKLILKVFKEINCSRLETLLPNGKIKMSNGRKMFLLGTAAVATLGLASRSLPYIGDMPWSYILFLTYSLVGLRIWFSYRNRRNFYMVSLSRTLYYKSIAHNRGVLTLLADRAVDEEFKGALLTYVCLLPTEGQSLFGFRSGRPLDSHDLEHKVAGWLQGTYGSPDVFDCADALTNLEMLSLLKRNEEGKLTVLSLDEALMVLPTTPTYSGGLWPQRADDEDEKIELTGQTEVGKQEKGWW